METLAETRERTLALVGQLSDEQLQTVYSKLLSPLAWDLGHIAAFEDLWLSRTFDRPLLRPELTATYDADETPRALRGALPILSPADAFEFLDDVRARTLELLDSGGEGIDHDRLELVIRHEQQHNETMLQAFQIAHLATPFGSPQATNDQTPAVSGLEFVEMPGGAVPIGAADELGFAYDNERPRHRVEVGPFQIGRSPVTNADWQEFIDAGGYSRDDWWSAAGREWRDAERATRPLGWTEDGRAWRLADCELNDPKAPVTHVAWFEAEAFANAHDARLPTEFEWELSATWDRHSGDSRQNPWGPEPITPERANVDHLNGGTLPVGALPDGASTAGLLALVGDVWEWTSSTFNGYPGFRAYPYREYSEQFFGDKYRVLRGGSWATRAYVISTSFRNWDLPQRRQIFSGLRLAREAA